MCDDHSSLRKEASDMKLFLTYAFTLIAAPLLIAGAASADDIIVPESWAGIWETTTIEIDCETLEAQPATVSLDTLCAGDIMNPEDPDGIFSCIGSITDETVHLECSGTVEIMPGCSLTISFESDGTRNGDNGSGVTISRFTYTGAACFFEDTCTRNETTSIRVGYDPSCVTPVASETWGSLKSVYR